MEKKKNRFVSTDNRTVILIMAFLVVVAVFQIVKTPTFNKPSGWDQVVVPENEDSGKSLVKEGDVAAVEKKFKLWFSQKQKDFFEREIPKRKITFGILEDGRIVEYTEAILIESDYSSNWDDAQFLGIGRFHHLE